MKKLFKLSKWWKVFSLAMFKRKHSNEDKIKFEIPIVRYLVYLLVVTLAVSGVSLSRYSVSSDTIQSGRVAKLAGSFTHDIWSDGDVDISVLPLGYTRHYVFTIKNDSEVAMRVRLRDATKEPPITNITVVDAGNASVNVDDNGWFDFSPAGSGADTRIVTMGLESTLDGNHLTIFFEYKQID